MLYGLTKKGMIFIMDKNMNNLIDNVKKMIDNGNIPPELQQMINNFQSQPNNVSQEYKNSVQNSSANQNSNPTNSNFDVSSLMNQIPPNMLNNLNSMLNSSNSSSSNTSQNYNNNSQNNSSNNNNFNIDINTIMKMKSIMEKMNNNDDPRANLLYSLKPYLRDSKKEKVDQYVNMLNITKIAEFMNNNDDKKK